MAARLLIVVLATVAAVPNLWSESADCGASVVVIPNGRITESRVAANATYWYGIYAQAGHSYAVEFESPADNYFSQNQTTPQFWNLAVYGPNDALLGCHGTSSVQVTLNSGYAPVIQKNSNGSGRRGNTQCRKWRLRC